MNASDIRWRMKIIIRKKSLYALLTWFVFTTVLLCLPGAAIPQHRWFDVLFFDKWVHVFLFSMLTFLSCRMVDRKHWILVVLIVIAYGTGMEFIQKWFVTNRSFDLGDIIADAAGAVLGYIVALRYLIVKTPAKTE